VFARVGDDGNRPEGYSIEVMEIGGVMDIRKPTIREILTAVVFVGIVGVLFVLNLILPSPEVLVSERRIPARFPDLNLNTISNGDFMDRFEDYAADHFVFRDTFRGINAFLIFDIYRQNDKSGLYRSNDVGLGQFYHMDETSFRETTRRITLAASIFDGFDMNIHYSIIPDKSIYAERFLPGFYLDKAEGMLFDAFSDYNYIRLADDLSAESYYKTDIHWDQTKITNVAEKLISGMGANGNSTTHPINTAGEFFGVYSGQYVLPFPPDIMTYFDIPAINASYLNERTLEFEEYPIYDHMRLGSVDPYEFFLRGPQPVIIIENENAPDRELYMFRDSFGSSLAPLMSDAYSKVIVIDLRYIQLSIIDQFIDFRPGSDVLFIFGSQIFNSPGVLLTSGMN